MKAARDHIPLRADDLSIMISSTSSELAQTERFGSSLNVFVVMLFILSRKAHVQVRAAPMPPNAAEQSAQAQGERWRHIQKEEQSST
eukprot:6385384-Pyramimonas_sp.AAC.1